MKKQIISNVSPSFVRYLYEVFQYKDLLKMYVLREIRTFYKQTIFGPLWFIVSPILSSGVYIAVFQNILGLEFDGESALLFYLTGLSFWTLFQEPLIKNTKVFILNQSLFQKIYFPRLIVPLANQVFSVIKFSIQLALLLIITFLINGTPSLFEIIKTLQDIFIPLLILSSLSLSLGLIFSSISAKYRDLHHIMSFGIGLLQFVTPIFYSSQYSENSWLLKWNPLVPLLQTYRSFFIEDLSPDRLALVFPSLLAVCLLFFGITSYRITERKIIDYI